MRTVVCRFQNQHDLRQHLRQNTPSSAPNAVSFLAGFDANIGDALHAILVVEDVQQQCAVRLTPTQQTPAKHHPELWAYTSAIHGEDQIWLKMFLSKLETLVSFSEALAA